jgi:hypothetical protein
MVEVLIITFLLFIGAEGVDKTIKGDGQSTASQSE